MLSACRRADMMCVMVTRVLKAKGTRQKVVASEAKCSPALVMSALAHHASEACEYTARFTKKTASSELLSVTQTLRLQYLSSFKRVRRMRQATTPPLLVVNPTR